MSGNPADIDNHMGSFMILWISVTSLTGMHHSGLAPVLQMSTTQGWHQSYRCAPLRVGTSLTGVHHSGLAPVLLACTTQGWHQSYRCAPLRVGTSLTGVHHSYRCAPLRVGTSLTGMHHSGLAPVLQMCTTQGWHQSYRRALLNTNC